MQISQKAEYAAVAVLDIALNATPDQGVRSSDISRRTGVPEKFLQAILLDLRKAGFLRSKRGPSGGHWLARPASRITVGEIVGAIDPAGEGRAGDVHRYGNHAGACLGTLWTRADAAARAILDEVTVEDLLVQARGQAASDFAI